MLQPMSRCSEPAPCPQCELSAPRVISAPRLNTMRADVRSAHQVNERSAHEPRAMKKHVCSSGCSHAPADENKTALRQSKSTSRPWMIGH